jgi:hypothetical protein
LAGYPLVTCELGSTLKLEGLQANIVPVNNTWVGFARGIVIRGFVYDFLSLLAPHLSRPLIDQAAACRTQRDVDALFDSSP